MVSQLGASFAGLFMQRDEIEAFNVAFQNGGAKAVGYFLKKKGDEWKNLDLNVGITGNSGTGKSTFINAIRGLKDYDDGAARVGVTETTRTETSYSHPQNERLQFWDMAGVGTQQFQRDNYVEQIGFEKFDFFLIMSCGRFTENDTMLAKEIISSGKKFFFVRTKIHVDMINNKRSTRDHDERKVLDTIRSNIRDNLGPLYQEDKVFLIDSYEPILYDFELLHQRVIEDFPTLKREAFILSATTLSVSMVKQKAETLRDQIWRSALGSAVMALIPIPGTSIVADVMLLVEQSEFYFKQLGLDDASLEQTAKAMACDIRDLKKIVEDRKVKSFLTMNGITELLMMKFPTVLVATALEELSKFIPIVGSILSSPISYVTTYKALEIILKNMEEVAVSVMKVAVEERSKSVE